MNIIVCKNYDEMSLRSAEIMAEVIKGKPACVLGMATGSTPIGLYRNLIRMNKAGEISFKDVTTVNLDEYYPIAPTNDQSYRYFMNEQLFDHVDIDKAKTSVPDGTAADPEAECRRYEEMISLLGGIDVQILGIGRNGHIGFNEPDAKLILDTHVTDLTASTIEANSRFFASEADVPRRALTMGIGSIFKARKIILMVSGAEKKAAVSALLSRTLDTNFPLTMLNLHPDVTLVCTADVLD
ncbi:MAG: glucosamine-6-phosphate deaminase [Clostridia bacterium]|nr:glucosamine-6-phosphate deaminase [Clostridia bacterium]